MMAKWVCPSVISCFIVVVISVVIVYSFTDEDAGRHRNINDPQPFRLNKLNMMWEKAKKVIMACHIRYFAIWRAMGADSDKYFTTVLYTSILSTPPAPPTETYCTYFIEGKY